MPPDERALTLVAPEVRAVRNLVAIELFSGVLTYHSYSQLILYPWGDDDNQSTEPAQNFGNPASRSHAFGWEAEEAVDEARKNVADLIPDAQGQVGIVNVKRLWKLNQEFWKDKKLPLKQEIIFASTGTKDPKLPADKYVEALAGSEQYGDLPRAEFLAIEFAIG